MKGDLSGLAMAGSPQSKLHETFAARAAEIGQTDWAYADNPVQFWDLYGEQGHPIRTTVSEMGPLLLSRLMDLNEVQEGVLTIAFTLADKEGLLILDLDDLQAMLAECAARADELTVAYGNVTKQSIGTIQRSLLQLRSQGGEHFFGEPALDMDDFHRRRRQGPRHRQHSGGRQIDGLAETLFDLPAMAAERAVRASAGGRRPRKTEARASSSTKRTCCSTRHPRRCSTRSNRSCA